MKKFLIAVALALACALPLAAQQAPINQNWNEVVALAPPALLNSQTFSNSVNTGFSQSATGGAIAAGTYRCGVTLFTTNNTETPLSTDTASTSTITTTGSTSSVTIQPPFAGGVPSNVTGWRPYCGVNGGATGAETLVVLNATVCTLGPSSTPSCALTSPAVLTLQSQFAAGAGGPATPGTAVFPPIANQANQAIFENSTMTYRVINWVVTGTAPGACTLNVQTGAAPASLSSIGQTITCTASGSYAVPNTLTAAYSSINLATYTPGSTTTQVAFYYTVAPFNPLGYIWFGPVAPTSACAAAVGANGLFISGANGASTPYTCVTTTWTAMTLP